MIQKTLTYKDFNGTERKEDFYFHLSQPELVDINIHFGGELSDIVAPLVAETKDEKLALQNKLKLYEIFKYLFLRAYGEKSEDGRRFIKSEQKTEEFQETAAYAALLMSLVENEEEMQTFCNGLTA